LKLQESPAEQPRPGWMRSIAEARGDLEDKISPTLRRDAQRNIEKLYARARSVASLGLLEHGERDVAGQFPSECPYTLSQILEDDWYPEPEHQ
jgi:hypothetical protein